LTKIREFSVHEAISNRVEVQGVKLGTLWPHFNCNDLVTALTSCLDLIKFSARMFLAT
jgi:hypothetical protein